MNGLFKTYDCLSDNLDAIMCGEYDDEFKDCLDKVRHISFLLNHITIDIDDDIAIFDYEGIVVKIRNIKTHISGEFVDFESFMISFFTKQDEFLRAYKVFERSYKIDRII